MSAIVDYTFYATVYMGQEADAASFPALCARATDIIGAMAHWRVTEHNIADLPAQIQTLYRKAICAQVDALSVNGLDSLSGDSGRGFTVGKVSISGKSGSDVAKKGALADSIAPLALMYLEQTGLMCPVVATAHDMPFEGWWP